MNQNFHNWVLAARPKTLPAAIAPVMMGTAMAFADGLVHWKSAAIALIAALSIQIGTNLANDYYDHKKGADRANRVGPIRVTQAGLIKAGWVKAGFLIFFLISAVACTYLVQRGGWPIAVIGIASILSGILYTAGPFPLAYIGLGELFVLIFFGPVAVGGTYYIQALEINPAILLSGLAPGLLSVAILSINNLRDIETDRESQKKTLAVRFGKSFAIYEYLVSVLAACLIPVAVYWLTRDYFHSLIGVLTLFFAIPVIKNVLMKPEGPTLNSALAHTGRLLLIYSILFSVGWIV